MTDNNTIHALILTKNEAQHIGRCIDSIRDICATITVIDSGSNDDTAELARARGATVIVNSWTNYARQFNFAIDSAASTQGWFLRIDADETIEPNAARALASAISGAPADIMGFALPRRIVFLGRRIRWGGIEPSWQLRVWRIGHGRCEDRWMDEHMIVDGTTTRLAAPITDHNLNSIGWWTIKHESYASREAIDQLAAIGLLDLEQASIGGEPLSRQAGVKRWIKNRVYNRLPMALRALAYFLFRYVILLGFLDRREGYYFHVLQGFWYRTLVDAKVAEIRATAAIDGLSITQAIRIRTGFDVRPGDEVGQRP